MKRIVIAMAALLVCSTLAIVNAAPKQAPMGDTASSVSGTLVAKEGRLFLTDESTHTMVEVRGEGLQKYVGKKVTVSGQVAPAAEGNPAVLTVSSVKLSAAMAGKATAAGVKAGLSKAAIGGIAAAGAGATVGTLYATGVVGGDEVAVSR